MSVFFKGKTFSRILPFLNYFPGLIVLVLAMFALHTSLGLMRTDEELLKSYQIQARHAGYSEEEIETLSTGFLSSIERREAWLYWSVISLGLAGFVLVLSNADKLRKLEILAEEKKHTFKLLQDRMTAIEATFDGIGIVDKEGNLSYMNQALRKLHGISEDEAHLFLGKKWTQLYTDKGREEVEKNVMPELLRKGYWRGYSPIVRRTGEVAHAELSLTSLPDGGFIGTARDITDQKQAEREKEILQGQFFQAQKMEAIGRLAGGIAHDFNNILAAMNGYAEFLVEDIKPDKPQHKFAQNILKAGIQARTLVDQMLTFSRRDKITLETFDLRTSVDESLSMLKASLPKTIDVKTEIKVRNPLITGSATQITQVLMNLCVNAKDAMGRKHGVLTVGVEDVDLQNYKKLQMVIDSFPDASKAPAIHIQDVNENTARLILGTLVEDHNYVRVFVKDTGSGMDRVVMEHVFEPFFTTKPVGKGTGLGLAMVHGVVTAHRGALIAESTIGKGTMFEILFPVAEATQALSSEEQIDEPQGLEGKHVLLVEDQEDVRHMMEAMLSRLKVESVSAENGLEALDLLRENPDGFDVVITDQNMPKMTGLELVEEAHRDFPLLPFIILSGYSKKRMDEVSASYPAVKVVLRKPVSRDVFARHLAAVIKENEGSRKEAHGLKTAVS